MFDFWDGDIETARNPEHEVWTPVPYPGYETAYMVSNLGRVIRIAGGPGVNFEAGKSYRFKAASPDNKGYPVVNLWINNKRKTVKLHVLVLTTFMGPPPHDEYGQYEGHHIEEPKTDCRLSNLEWITPKENREEEWHRYITNGEARPDLR